MSANLKEWVQEHGWADGDELKRLEKELKRFASITEGLASCMLEGLEDFFGCSGPVAGGGGVGCRSIGGRI